MTDTLYTSLELVKAALLPTELSPGGGLDDTITAAIPPACRAIDGICGQFFYLTGDSTDGELRTFTARRPHRLDERDRLSPIVAIDSIDIDRTGTGAFDTTLEAGTDYLLEPVNNHLAGRPYDEILIHPRSRQRFPLWPQAIRITARYGWPEVPEAVKAAALLLAEEIVKLPTEAPLGVVTAATPGLDVASAIRIARNNPKVMAFLENENLVRHPVLG